MPFSDYRLQVEKELHEELLVQLGKRDYYNATELKYYPFGISFNYAQYKVLQFSCFTNYIRLEVNEFDFTLDRVSKRSKRHFGFSTRSLGHVTKTSS